MVGHQSNNVNNTDLQCRKEWKPVSASHCIMAVPQTDIYWRPTRKLAGSKFGTALMAARTVVIATDMNVLVHTKTKLFNNLVRLQETSLGLL